MSFEWDPQKAASNQRKHKVDFADAATVFEDEAGITIDDDTPAEERFINYRDGCSGARAGRGLDVAGRKYPAYIGTQGHAF